MFQEKTVTAKEYMKSLLIYLLDSAIAKHYKCYNYF